MLNHHTFLALCILWLFSVVSHAATNKVDLNAATAEELDEVPGIGAISAQRIIEMRPITSLDQLEELPGFGRGRVEALGQYVTFDDAGIEPATAAIAASIPAATPVLELAKNLETVTTAKPVVIPLFRDEKRIGEMTLPTGTKLAVVSQTSETVTALHANGQTVTLSAADVQESLPTTATSIPKSTPVPALPDDLKTDLRLAEKFLKDDKLPQPKNWKHVVAKWEQDSEADSTRRSAEARWNLGKCYLNGVGVEKDTAKGIHYYESAAELDPAGWRLLNIANLYRGTESVPADTNKEIYWSRKSAEEANYVWGQYNLARLYGDNSTVEPDYTAALEWAQKALQNNPPERLAKTLRKYVEDFSKLREFATPVKFEISVAGSPVKISRIGQGPQGVIFFSHTGAKAMRKSILLNQDWFKDLLPEKCSFFLWEYPESAPFDKVEPTLTSYMQGDKSARLPLPSIASSVVAQIKQKSGLNDFLIVGNSLGAGIVLQDYASLVGDKALNFLLISPTEAFMPPIESIPLLERTTLIGATVERNRDTQLRADPWLVGKKAWEWVAKNRATEWEESMTLNGADFERGHFTIGEKITAELLAKFIRIKLGLADRAILGEAPQQTDGFTSSSPLPKPFEETRAAPFNLKHAEGVPLRPTLPRTFPLSRPTQIGEVVAWGFAEGSNGQDPEALQSILPPAGLMAVQISANRDSSSYKIHCLALKSDGTVTAWGWNGEGQCDVPSGLDEVVSVIAGDGVSLAVKSDGSVTAWGSGKLFSSLPSDLATVVRAVSPKEGRSSCLPTERVAT